MLLQKTDIRDIFRINKKEGIPTIIVDFVHPKTKQDIVKKVRNFNKKNSSNKLNTSHIKLQGPSKPIYVSECLTQKAQRLYYLARNFAKDNLYQFCWTSRGRVYIKRAEEEKQILIDTAADLKSDSLET